MKIKELSPDVLEQLVELECQNILPILASVGINLTPDHMRQQLEFFKDSDVVISQEDGQVDGFAMYEVKDTAITVISFNLKKFNSFRVLSTLLNEIFRGLKETKIDSVKSHAHHTNIRSLNFHRKMGFKEVGRTEHHVEFEVSKKELLAIIQKRIPKTEPG
jgi:hypothetical protein